MPRYGFDTVLIFITRGPAHSANHWAPTHRGVGLRTPCPARGVSLPCDVTVSTCQHPRGRPFLAFFLILHKVWRVGVALSHGPAVTAHPLRAGGATGHAEPGLPKAVGPRRTSIWVTWRAIERASMVRCVGVPTNVCSRDSNLPTRAALSPSTCVLASCHVSVAACSSPRPAQGQRAVDTSAHGQHMVSARDLRSVSAPTCSVSGISFSTPHPSCVGR